MQAKPGISTGLQDVRKEAVLLWFVPFVPGNVWGDYEKYPSRKSVQGFGMWLSFGRLWNLTRSESAISKPCESKCSEQPRAGQEED